MAVRDLLNDAPVFEALGDETRLRLVVRLCDEGPLSIAQLTAGTAITRQGVTKHLRLMLEAGLVLEQRQGRQSVWQIQPQPLQAAGAHLHQISQQWDEALARLKALVED